MKKLNAFEIENQRHKLAAKGKLKLLAETYSPDFPEISDLNTSKLWDRLNRRDELKLSRNYMEHDKLKWVSREIRGRAIKVLNIGFGSANLEEIILRKKNDYDWNGIDISSESVANAIKKFPGSKFNKGDIKKLKYKENYFDIVLALEVLEHIPPKKILNVLNEVSRVLKPGGKLIVSVPLNEGLEELIKNGQNPNAHVRIYTEELIVAELKLAGLSFEKQYLIYAFSTLYKAKTLFVKYVYKKIKQPNGIIVVVRKK